MYVKMSTLARLMSPDVDIIISDADAVSLYLLILLLKYAGY